MYYTLREMAITFGRNAWRPTRTYSKNVSPRRKYTRYIGIKIVYFKLYDHNRPRIVVINVEKE